MMVGERAREMDWGSSKPGTPKACWRAPAVLVAHSPLHPREQRMRLQVMTAGGGPVLAVAAVTSTSPCGMPIWIDVSSSQALDSWRGRCR